MADRALLTDVRMRVGAFVCVCFLLTSTGWLSWLYRIMAVDASLPADAITMVGGYLLQAVGVGAYALCAQRMGSVLDRRILCGAILVYLALLVPSTMSSSAAVVLACGLLANIVCGVIQGFYLVAIAYLVRPDSQGVVFGCSYAASTLLSWLQTLPAGGALTQGVPCLLLCCTMAAATMVLQREIGTDAAAAGDWDGHDGGDSGALRATVMLACAAILMASLVKTAGFSFPSTDISAGVSVELPRLCYGCGLAVAGVVSDRDRRWGFFCCSAALVAPFLMLSLAGAGATGLPLWLLAYFLSGFYAVFRVMLAMDVARKAGMPVLASMGLLFGRMGDAIGTGLYLSLGARPIGLIAATTVGFVVTIALFLVVYQRLYEEQVVAVPQVEDRKQAERAHFETFCQSYSLTARERDVLRLVLEEKTNPEIAGELTVTEATIKYHVRNILKKTCCKSRLDVMAAYAEAKA